MCSSMDVDIKNKVFWDELCGTTLAVRLGITDHSLESLKKFDDAYLDYYPYLLKHVPINLFHNKQVLEVGLGYGTLGQKIFEMGGNYTGLDIAKGPVDMMNHRLQMLSNGGVAEQGSMLNCPFSDNAFDVVVSIGCFHHTGNLQRCIDETYRVLKPGGWAYIMVYNKFSYRNWLRWPVATFKALSQQGSAGLSAAQRGAYDSSIRGESAPETVFTSIAELEQMFRRYSTFRARKENLEELRLSKISIVPRKPLLNIVGHSVGLDIYASASK